MSRRTNKPRLFPNDVVVESVEVIGEPLNLPVLLNYFNSSGSGSRSDSGSGCPNSGSGLYPEDYDRSCNQTQEEGMREDERDSEEPQFVMIVSEFQVSYSVLDCGYGMPLPVGYYEADGYAPMTVKVDIEQVIISSLAHDLATSLT